MCKIAEGMCKISEVMCKVAEVMRKIAEFMRKVAEVMWRLCIFSKVCSSKVYFCEMYPTCVSSKLCEFISFSQNIVFKGWLPLCVISISVVVC